MIGIRELTAHLLYVTKRQGVEEETIYKGSFSKLVFLAFVECYKEDIQINYDILFHKSTYGASSHSIDKMTGDCYSRKVSYENAKENLTLSRNSELSRKFNEFIRAEAKSPLVLARKITSSPIFQKILKEYEELKEQSSFRSQYLLLPMDIDLVWTLPEILLFAGIDNIEDYDTRIPLDQTRYEAIEKYLELKEITVNNRLKNETVEALFTLDDIHILRQTSEELLDTIRIHGAKVSDE